MSKHLFWNILNHFKRGPPDAKPARAPSEHDLKHAWILSYIPNIYIYLSDLRAL